MRPQRVKQTFQYIMYYVIINIYVYFRDCSDGRPLEGETKLNDFKNITVSVR